MKLLKKIAIGIGTLMIGAGAVLIVIVGLLALFLSGLPDLCGNKLIVSV